MDQHSAIAPLIEMGVGDEDLQRIIGSVPPRTDLVAVLQHWAAERGDQPAFYFTDGEEGQDDLCLTFAQLDLAGVGNFGGGNRLDGLLRLLRHRGRAQQRGGARHSA